MMHHTDPTPPNPYYPQHNHFPPNPNPNPEPYPNPNPNPASSASAPPLSSSFSPPEYQSYPYYPQNTPTAPSFPPYDHAAPSYYPYDQSPIPPAPPGPNFDNYGGYADQNNTTAYGGVEGDVDVYEGAYRYQGGAHGEPYGARGTAGLTSSSSRSEVLFDDYGRPINVSGGGGGGGGGGDHGGGKGSRVVRARPKEDTEEEEGGKSGVLKFRVKVLAEGSGQSDLDVLCQIGLDGIRMLDPATSRTLRVYPFESVTRWEVLDSYIFAFWAKMPVDIEPKRIRLKSNSYTTNTILDTVTAASVQLKEIAEGKDPNSSRTSEQPGEKKKGFGDWMNMMKPPNEEKDHWVPDEAVNKCVSCDTNFNAFVRKHHCRNCGEIFCDKCTQGRTPLTLDEEAPPVRVCDRCMAEVTQRLENAKEAANRSGKFLSHEDLARRLKEELSRNSKASSVGSKYEGAQTHKREVACPICTVHLQVEVPSSGSETIECSVCQHPFLISAN